ncbi:glycoside hydrolase family 20 [Prolixibacteraceae bacterium JC049]|nr:glycoside hydrolase family 20 [Prolixibacteraceae bacterium JC049]
MKNNIVVILIGLVLFSCSKPREKADKVQLIPFPNEIALGEYNIDLSEGVAISGEIGNKAFLKDLLSEKNISSGKRVKIEFQTDKSITDKEAYELIAKDRRITIKSSAKSGEFYALMTLRQLIKGGAIPEVHIKDRPAFKWRAFMLDESRHFQGKEVVIKLLNEMAALKMNVFHWHLTDDQGWRIEIKKYPLLTQVGSRRDSTQVNDGRGSRSKTYDGKSHGGFYTQTEIKEIVEYAAKLNIQVVPEIGMPGHFSAAIASYPYLGTQKKKIKVPCKFGVGTDVLDPSSDKTIQFLHDVLDEVNALFPSQVIHIGGDEVRYDHWKKSSAVKAYKKKYQLPTFSDVQVKFTNDISKYIESKFGKRAMGWNEILGERTHSWAKGDKSAKTELSKNAIIHFWHGSASDFQKAISRGYNVVNSTSKYTYLDYSYRKINLEKAYRFQVVPKELSAEEAQQILGLGCQMWTEWTPKTENVYHRVFPRIAAYAENGWTSEGNKDYTRFKEALQVKLKEWQKLGIKYGPLDAVKKVK